jgi:hypothetical protein
VILGWFLTVLPMFVIGQSAPGEAELDAVVQIGLRWLADRQAPDGSFGKELPYGAPVGTTSLCCLAFVADGHLPTRGRWARTVQQGLDYVLSQADETGLIAASDSAVPMYSHGYATLLLAELYGESPQADRVKAVLQRAVRLIAAAQNEEGGWRYQPVPDDADISVSTCQLWALRAVHDAGLEVPAATVERGLAYVRRLHNADGGFRYQTPEGESAYSRTAAAVTVLQAMGSANSPQVRAGLDYLWHQRPPAEREAAYYYYGQYYAAQAFHAAGGRRWRQWWPDALRGLLDRRDESGEHWVDEYQTAMALLVIQTPQRQLSTSIAPAETAEGAVPGESPDVDLPDR